MGNYAGIFFGDAPQFIMLSIIGAFLIGYINFAYRLMADVDPRDKGFYDLQMKRMRLNDIILLVAFLLAISRIIYCNFVRKEILPDTFLHLTDVLILLLIVIALAVAKNFFRDGLIHIKTYSSKGNEVVGLKTGK